MMRILNLSDLRDRGIPFSRQHIHRLVVAGKFPKPVKLGRATNGWVEDEINEYLLSCIAERDAGAGPSQPTDSVKAAPAVQPWPQRRRRRSRPAADAGASAA
jgi:prophage regulatory protein